MQISKEAELTVQNISRTCNSFNSGDDAKYIVSQLANEHRTIQQSIIGNLVIPLVMEFALKYYKKEYDARNEQACYLCYLMSQTIDAKYENGFHGLPMI